MKRWLVICAAVGLFVLGVVSGVLLENRAKAQFYREICLAPFVHHATDGLFTMMLIAEGRSESVYDLAEGASLLCVAPKPEQRSREMITCARNLKAFYDKYPERKANLERSHPAEAARLGLAATP
jgi:hypothetical protein